MVPPPRLPSVGELLNISRDTSCVSCPLPGCVATPLLFTTTETSYTPAAPASSVQVISVEEAIVTSQFRSPAETTKSDVSVVNPVPMMVSSTEPSTTALTTDARDGVSDVS